MNRKEVFQFAKLYFDDFTVFFIFSMCLSAISDFHVM